MINLYKNKIHDYYNKLLQSNDSTVIPEIDKVANSIGFTRDRMLELLANLKHQTDYTTNNNRIWYRYCIVTILMLLVNFIIISITTKAYLKPKYYIMIMETILTFILVGGIEMIFFISVASKYVPVVPSEIVKMIKDDLFTALNSTPTNSILPYL